MQEFRNEHDMLGSMAIPADALYGIHTARAIENFPIACRPVPAELIHAYGTVKQACLQTCREIGAWQDTDAPKVDAMLRACGEMAAGLLDQHIKVDLLQGGAGTSLNMNVNEVLANRSLELLSMPKGAYDTVHPIGHINRFQSTNDTYPTALKLAAIRQLVLLEQRLVNLQESFQRKEKEFVSVVKIGRTQLQDAVLTTLGREMSAYAEAFNRDRWRVYKCVERLRVINLGGTAIGTGLAAPREYIFAVSETLRDITGIGFARAENLVECTQNADVFVEVSGILKACAASLLKVAGDLRIMSSGPVGGLAEIKLPSVQAGSSIMPGKVNPVIPEAASQAAMKVMANDVAVTTASAGGNLELNPFLPLVADCLLESIGLLARACESFAKKCVDGIEADEAKCREYVNTSSVAATALVPVCGYKKASEIAADAHASNRTVRDVAVEAGIITETEYDNLLSAEAVCRLGHPMSEYMKDTNDDAVDP